jgi:hypothetical protein
MGTRFIAWLLGAFLVTVVTLGGAGYAVTQFAVPAQRDMHRTEGYEFELAPGWLCERVGTEDLCEPPGGRPRAAIAIMTMKERGPQDTLEHYEAHLKTPQPVEGRNTVPGQTSDVQFVRREVFGNRQWVTALHSGSEVPNYETYYLATVTSYLGILVTMSVHKRQAPQYIGQLNEMMRTLRTYQR